MLSVTPFENPGPTDAPSLATKETRDSRLWPNISIRTRVRNVEIAMFGDISSCRELELSLVRRSRLVLVRRVSLNITTACGPCLLEDEAREDVMLHHCAQ